LDRLRHRRYEPHVIQLQRVAQDTLLGGLTRADALGCGLCHGVRAKRRRDFVEERLAFFRSMDRVVGHQPASQRCSAQCLTLIREYSTIKLTSAGCYDPLAQG
jgi:uncharacterized Fe-S cluster-containing radical SAM superfamily protein